MTLFVKILNLIGKAIMLVLAAVMVASLLALAIHVLQVITK